MIMSEEKKDQKPEAYPRPTEKDNQLHNNAEFIDQQPNDFRDKSISDLPANDETVKISNEPER